MARRRGNALDLTGIEPGAFSIVPEGNYNVVLSEAFIYVKDKNGVDTISFILDIEDGDQEGQKLFLNHELTNDARKYLIATLLGLGFVTDDDRGADGKSPLVVDYDVERGKDFRKRDQDMIVSVIVNDNVRPVTNRHAVATVVHKTYTVSDGQGGMKDKTAANVSSLECLSNTGGTSGRARTKKFGF